MNTNIYLDELEGRVFRQISSFFNFHTIEDIIKNFVIDPYVNKKHIRDFYEYYYDTLNNKEYFLNTPDFFKVFCEKYGVNGLIDEQLEILEDNKNIILNCIENNILPHLYLNAFKMTKHGEVVFRNSNYLFSKIVHTFSPYEYTPLDDKIKNYFGLENESFYIAFELISQNYVAWSRQNPDIMEKLQSELKKFGNMFNLEKMTHVKLLDSIFWGYTQ